MRTTFASLTALLAGFVLTGCASTPRPYAPVVGASVDDQTAFDDTYAYCSEAVAEGRRSDFLEGRAASGVTGAGASTAVLVGGGTASVAALSAAGATATLVGAVVIAPVAAVTQSRMRRHRRETDINDAMTVCLAEFDYAVDDWELAETADTGEPRDEP